MKVPPLAVGAGAGLLLALLLAPATGGALGDLSRARADRAKAAADAAVPAGPQPALVAPGLVTGEAAALVARVRARAKDGGVLVEEAAELPVQGALARVRLRLSGPEKAVLALADSLEREPPLVRLAAWRIDPIEGGLRLTAEAVAVRQ
ncbi:hypothetical protein ACFQ1E_05590 [Sphingomonas canadensis]|uniref:Uncharacterized protein n=1 Tax=Sphingomonas canadensis TaxID=1219257 RepID=A0ABW3H921_9SPHN|nr:hypothetical protein [Sphingomonas canadensis]MCW3835739.1 hypothetical protein [Sphingomonas canadensis]